jgi:hypothetical protein
MSNKEMFTFWFGFHGDKKLQSYKKELAERGLVDVLEDVELYEKSHKEYVDKTLHKVLKLERAAENKSVSFWKKINKIYSENKTYKHIPTFVKGETV